MFWGVFMESCDYLPLFLNTFFNGTSPSLMDAFFNSPSQLEATNCFSSGKSQKTIG